MSQSIQLSSRISPIGTAQLNSAIEGFKHVLDADQRQDFESSNDQPDAATVLKFTAHLDEINSERRSRCIATRLQTVLQSVQQFSTIVETFVSSNPKIAALVWGTLKFALLIASNFGSYFEKLSALFMKFGRHCPRYAEYQALYLDSTRLQSGLCSFYAILVSCCTRAVEITKRPGWIHVAKIIALSSFESDFGSFEQELQHWSKEIKNEITATSHRIAGQERCAQSEERARAEDYRIWHWRRAKEQELEMEKLRLSELHKSHHEAQAKKVAVQQKRSLLDKLSDHDYNRPWTRARRKCVVSTGQWLTHTKQFDDWVSEPASSLLCLTGKLGSGKTVLTASAISELSRHPGSEGHIAYFFCRFDDELSLHATTILSSLLKQILRPESLTPGQQSLLERMMDPGPPELTELESLLKDTISSTQFIVIDAFDECSEVERRLLLKSFRRIMNWPDRTVKLFLSSRDGDGWRVNNMFQDAYFVSTNSQMSSEDLRTLVKRRLDSLVEEENLRVGHRDILCEIEDHLLNKAQGMFLWVDLALQDLCSQRRDCDIRAALQRLPIGLPEMYNRLLGRISNSGERKLVPRIFHWIACAKRLLSLEELAEAIAIKPLQKSSEPERYVNDITQIPSWSRGLVTCDEEDNALQFAHSTVKDFLLGKCLDKANSDFHFEMEIADHELGEICVTYLNFSDFERQLVQRPKPQVSIRGDDLLKANINAISGQTLISRTVSNVLSWRTLKSDTHFVLPRQQNNTTALQGIIGSHPFLRYASKYWIFHCQNFTQSTSTWSLWNRLLLSESSILETEWTVEELSNRTMIIMSFIRKHQHYGLLEWVQTSENRFSDEQVEKLLENSAEEGAWQMVKKVLETYDTTQKAKSFALQIAAKGNLQMVEMLIHVDADVNAPPTTLPHLTALQTASAWGQLQIVERLLDVGADVNAPALYRTALQAAAEQGHIEVIEKLLSAGAKVNAPPAKHGGRIALQAAADEDHYLMVEKTLNADAEVNALPEERCGRTALQAAADGGHAQVVEMLLNKGADVNAPAEQGGRTALQAAADGDNIRIVEMLLNKGADVNAPAEQGGRTALQAAAARGHVQVVRMLLDAGADANAPPAEQDGRTTLLQAAAEGGHFLVVEMLLDAGADVNALSPEQNGRTALQAAATQGNTMITNSLLNAGADVNARGTDGKAALELAVQGGHRQIADMLRAKGAR